MRVDPSWSGVEFNAFVPDIQFSKWWTPARARHLGGRYLDQRFQSDMQLLDSEDGAERC